MTRRHLCKALPAPGIAATTPARAQTASAEKKDRFLCQLKKSAVALGAALLVSSASADEVKVLTTGILKGSFPQIAAQFESETGHKVIMSWGRPPATRLKQLRCA